MCQKKLRVNGEKLFKTNKTEQELSNFIRKINTSSNKNIGLLCRGERMQEWKGFANEISAVLQFPYYFSGGYDSLHECIRDLDWIAKKRIFVFVTNFDQLLLDESRNFISLFKDSVIDVPIDSMKYNNEERYVYYIFQNTNQDFPLFENQDISKIV